MLPARNEPKLAGAADFSLEPGDYRYFLPKPRGTFPNYSFFKNRGAGD